MENKLKVVVAAREMLTPQICQFELRHADGHSLDDSASEVRRPRTSESHYGSGARYLARAPANPLGRGSGQQNSFADVLT